ncbi:MAG: hypothetical protein DMG70_26190 [Acidobacteria bacterium]|nr:MAG: hypothetical protein DMG70_26190 [Acidobacteriota bacterium]PYY06482.1 MAG: hypothetical protein DMG69_23220 [Acidobacteriota bacterium]
MKSRIASKCLGSLFAVVLTIAMAAPAHAEDPVCSLARSAGKWSFTDQGTVLPIGPRTAVGVFTFDGTGNLHNGVATSSLAGAVASETFSGTYAVNPDCTGTISVEIFASGTEILAVTLSIAFDEDMKHMRGIFTSAATPNGTQLPTVINLDARKQ